MSIWEDISNECKNLIYCLLKTKESRITLDKVFKHLWVQKYKRTKDAKIEVSPTIMSNLKSFQEAKKIKKAVFSYIATQLSEKEIEPLRKIFKSLDKNGDGKLSYKEVQQGLKGHGDEEELSKLIIGIDTDNNGYIEYNEFLAAAMGGEFQHYEQRLENAFKIIDKDGSGKISVKELKSILKTGMGKVEVDFWESIIKEADINGDGEMDYSEFVELMNNMEK